MGQHFCYQTIESRLKLPRRFKMYVKIFTEISRSITLIPVPKFLWLICCKKRGFWQNLCCLAAMNKAVPAKTLQLTTTEEDSCGHLDTLVASQGLYLASIHSHPHPVPLFTTALFSHGFVYLFHDP